MLTPLGAAADDVEVVTSFDIIVAIEAVAGAAVGLDRRGRFAIEPDNAPRGNEKVAAARLDMMDQV